MVGEWFNKEFMQVGEVAGNLGGRIFDDYFGSREDLISFYDSFTERNLQYKESFFALLNPYKQDVNSNSIVSEGASLYDINDYYTSRFKYALTSYNEFQYQRIDLNAHYDIDIDVTVATNDEFRANKFTVELETNNRYAGYGMSQEFYCTSTTGYVKIVYPATGESYIWNSGNYYSNWHISINSNNIDDYKNYYVYACDSTGKAMGYIRNVQSGNFTKTIDLSELKYLNIFETYGPFYGESIDFSGLNYLSRVVISLAHLLKNIIGLNSKKLDFFSLQKADLIENIDISELTNLTYLSLEYLPLLESLDIQNNTKLNTLYIGYVDITLDVTGLTNLNTIQYNKLTMTSDDVDDLLIQLASTDLIGSGNVSIDRISRSSYSDDAFNTLMSKSWNINLGSYFYDEEIIPNKLVLTIDPTRVVNEMINYGSYEITTTTGYWIGKLWSGELIGNFVGSSINHRLAFSDDDANLEIYSCNEYGVPQGEITEVNLYQSDFKNIDTSELVALERFVTVYSRASIESLDFTYNYNLVYLTVENNNTLQSINVSGLTSLEELNLTYCRNLVNVTGFSTLSSLIQLRLRSLSGLDYLSLEGINTIRLIEIDNLDLYDSTHVDTMLSELNVNSAAGVASLDAQIAIKQPEVDALTISSQQAIDAYNAKSDEVQNLINSGADQSLIDAAQAELDILNTNSLLIKDQKYIAVQELDTLQTQRQNYFSGRNLNTFYMARTSASDADYDSLLTYGWNLQLGSEFVSPYTEPVKGFFTYDWTDEQDSSDNIFIGNQTLKLSSSTGFVKYVSGRYSDVLSVGTDYSNLSDFYNQIVKGVTEFWSCDSHGRASGSITGFGHGQNYNDYMKSFNISNLTEIKNIYLYGIKLSSIDLSSNINIESINIGETYNKLESIVGFENLVNLKDIYISNSVSKLDIPVDFTSMPNLQRIKLWELGINKNSRLNISGLTKLQSVGLSWTNILSVDLDNALLALDAAGLDSEFDFNYEGHLNELGNEIKLNIGMGIDHHTIADAAFTSLESKGWSLNTGDQIIDSIEDPTKGIVRWGMDATWIALGFNYNQDRDVMVKDPYGNTYLVGSMFSLGFNQNSIDERVVEFWGVDNYGRPRHDVITRVHDSWNTGITSFEANNVKSIEEISLDNAKVTSVDLSNMNNLMTIYIENTNTLLSLNVDGCSKIRNIFVNSSYNLDIDGLLESLDGTGSEGDTSLWGNNQISANGLVRTSASDTFVESLSSKKWNINVIDPAGTTVVINVIQQQYVLINVATTGGAVKFEFPVGSEMYNWAGPNGYIQHSCKYRGENDFNQTSLSFYPDFTGQVRITSVNSNDTNIVSGEVRMLQFMDQGTLNYSTATKVRSIYLNSAHSLTMLPYLSNLQLDSLNIYSYQGNTLNLSQFISKGIHIYYAESQNVILNQNCVKKLSLENSNQLVSVNIPDTVEKLRISSPLVQVGTVWPSVLTDLYLEGMNNIEEISGLPTSLEYLYLNNLINLDILDIPNSVRSLNLTNVSLNGVNLDLSGSTIRDIYISTSQLASIDVTGSTNLYSINLYYTSLDTIGLETTNVRYFYDYYSGKINYNLVLPDTFIDGGIYSTNTITSIDVSVENNTWLPNAAFNFNDLSNYGQISYPSIKNIYVRQSNSTSFDFTSIDSRTTLTITNLLAVTSLDFTGVSVNELIISWCLSLTTISGLSGSMQNLNIDHLHQLTNIDLSNLSLQSMNLSNVSNFTGAVNSTNLYINNCSNINLSGSNINYLQAYYCYGSMNLSNVTCNWQIRVWWGSFSSIILDGANAGEISIAYTNGYTPPGPGQTMQNWAISAVGTRVNGEFGIYNNQKLTSVTTTGTTTSVFRYTITNNTHLTSLSVSFRNTTTFYSYNNLDSLLISDAELSSSQLSYVGVFRFSGSNTETFIDSFINSVSPTNANNGQLRATGLNLRTSSSTTGFNKLISQGWTTMSV